MAAFKYIPPDHTKRLFTCTHDCNANTQHIGGGNLVINGSNKNVEDSAARYCAVCKKYTIWVHVGTNNPRLIYPVVGILPPAHPDMPDSIKEIYDEARLVSTVSVRYGLGAFRTCVEAIVNEQGIKDKNLYKSIKKLCSKVGINREIEAFFELIRITGNNSMHLKETYTMDNRIYAKLTF